MRSRGRPPAPPPPCRPSRRCPRSARRHSSRWIRGGRHGPGRAARRAASRPRPSTGRAPRPRRRPASRRRPGLPPHRSSPARSTRAAREGDSSWPSPAHRQGPRDEPAGWLSQAARPPPQRAGPLARRSLEPTGPRSMGPGRPRWAPRRERWSRPQSPSRGSPPEAGRPPSPRPPRRAACAGVAPRAHRRDGSPRRPSPRTTRRAEGPRGPGTAPRAAVRRARE